jgi:helicase MOV-10
VQEHRISSLARSITSTAEALRPSQSIGTRCGWLERMLFPMLSDGFPQITLPKGQFPGITWIDPQLNYEQQKAVDAVLNAHYGSVPYLVSGPPGTGKTKTIVEATLQLLQRSPPAVGCQTSHQKPHILVCAPSDPAADTLASRLAEHLVPTELFRLNGWSRSFPEVSGSLLPYCCIENDLFSLPSFDVLMSYKVVVTTCRDADMLLQARLTNRDINHLARSMMRVFAPQTEASSPGSQILHWTALLMDEAAQAMEPEALIPLTVVATPADPLPLDRSLVIQPQVIMAGDEYQLGPRLYSEKGSALSISLFARIFSRDLYAQHPLARQRGSQRLTSSMLPMIYPAFTNLIRNYRSHPAILSVPSLHFYSDTLVPEFTSLTETVQTWPGWQAPFFWPVLFVQNTTPDSVESVLTGNGSGAGALLNHGEASYVVRLAQDLLERRTSGPKSSEAIEQSEIAVMSPFTAQVHLLRKKLREASLYDVNVGPLEAFQGLESRVVIICTTRSRREVSKGDASRFVKEDQKRGVGVIGEPKRFNVAVTRAKEGLIVLGDPETMTVEGDPCWVAFLNFCVRNGCVRDERGPESSGWEWAEKLAMTTKSKEGRLEKALNFAVEMKARELARNEQRAFGFSRPPKKNSSNNNNSKNHSQSRFALKGPMPTTDEDMWKTGLQMAEAMESENLLVAEEEAPRPAAVEEGENTSQQRCHNPATIATTATTANTTTDVTATTTETAGTATTGATIATTSDLNHLADPHAPTANSQKPNPISPPTNRPRAALDEPAPNSLDQGGEFDRDPHAEFERTDCATQ